MVAVTEVLRGGMNYPEESGRRRAARRFVASPGFRSGSGRSDRRPGPRIGLAHLHAPRIRVAARLQYYAKEKEPSVDIISRSPHLEASFLEKRVKV